MLSSIRNSRKILQIVLWLVILAFVSTIFVVWGIGSRENQGAYVVKIGDTVVGYEEYRTFYDNTVANLKNTFGDAFEIFMQGQNLDELVTNELINRKLMLQEAKRLEIPLSDIEVIEAIKAVPAFHNDKGEFDTNIYTQALSYFRQTPAVFESAVRDDLLVNKFQLLVSNAQYEVSEAEIMNEYNYRNTKAQVSYFSVPVTNFISKETPKTEELQQYYEDNKFSYEIPAKVKLKYVIFDKNSAKSENIEISTSDIENYYNANISNYTTPENVEIRSITVSVSDWNNENQVKEAKEKIDNALAELKNNVDFSTVVKKYADKLVAENNGVIGRVFKGQMEPEMEKIVFSTEKGKFTDVIKSSNGYNIILVDNKTPEIVAPLNEKIAEITEIFKQNNKESSYRNDVLNTYRNILSSGNITSYVETNKDSGLVVSSTELFEASNPPLPVFLSNQDALKNIFLLNKTEISQLIEDGDITYLFEVEEKIPAIIPAYDEVKERVLIAFKENNAKKTAIADMDKALEKGFDEAIKVFNGKAIKSKEFLRNSPEDILSSADELINSIFKSKKGDTIKKAYLIGDNVYAIKVDNIILPNTDDYLSEKDTIATYIRSIKSEEALSSYIESLRLKNKIVINPAFITKDTVN